MISEGHYDNLGEEKKHRVDRHRSIEMKISRVLTQYVLFFYINILANLIDIEKIIYLTKRRLDGSDCEVKMSQIFTKESTFAQGTRLS